TPKQSDRQALQSKNIKVKNTTPKQSDRRSLQSKNIKVKKTQRLSKASSEPFNQKTLR
ncbi:hypothetical protein HOG98_07475, partial [bacterium]|nr:hypothetical protein [bacterium]